MQAERGTGKGDPLSSHLYYLAANPLNIMLAESDIVPRPILPNNKEITLEAYADDNGIPLSNNIQRIKDTIELIKNFKNVSGLELSIQKCNLMFTQACSQQFKTQLTQTANMKEVRKIKYLGLTITNKGEIKDEDNLEPILQKIKKQIKSHNMETHFTPRKSNTSKSTPHQQIHTCVTKHNTIRRNDSKNVERNQSINLDKTNQGRCHLKD